MIVMKKGNSTKDVWNEDLVPFYKTKGWEEVDTPASPVRAALKPTKKAKKEFTEVIENDESETVDETPAAIEASVENAIEQGD